MADDWRCNVASSLSSLCVSFPAMLMMAYAMECRITMVIVHVPELHPWNLVTLKPLTCHCHWIHWSERRRLEYQRPVLPSHNTSLCASFLDNSLLMCSTRPMKDLNLPDAMLINNNIMIGPHIPAIHSVVVHCSLCDLPYSLIIPMLISKIVTTQPCHNVPPPSLKSVPIYNMHICSIVIRGNHNRSTSNLPSLPLMTARDKNIK